jgi:DNA-binding transcriptional MerR regulator
MTKAQKRTKDKSGDLTRLTRALPAKAALNKRLYTLPELVRLAGMTRKQATHWAKIGLLRPALRNSNAQTGKPASFYSAKDVIKAFIICELRRAGFTPRQVQKVASNLGEHSLHLEDSKAYLLTDGYSVFYANSDNEVVDILKHHRQMLLLVPIHEQVEKLKNVA